MDITAGCLCAQAPRGGAGLAGAGTAAWVEQLLLGGVEAVLVDRGRGMGGRLARGATGERDVGGGKVSASRGGRSPPCADSVARLEAELARDLVAQALPPGGAQPDIPLAPLIARSSVDEDALLSARYSSRVLTCLALLGRGRLLEEAADPSRAAPLPDPVRAAISFLRLRAAAASCSFFTAAADSFFGALPALGAEIRFGVARLRDLADEDFPIKASSGDMDVSFGPGAAPSLL